MKLSTVALFAAMQTIDATGRNLASSSEEAVACNQERGALDFLLVEGDATGAAVEDDIRQHLEVFGFTVNAVKKPKDEFNADMQSGNFHMAFTESWGNPYDPHSYASGWIGGSGGDGNFEAFANFNPPASREELFELINDVMKEEDRKERRAKWENIHNYYHAQAVMLPLWGKRIPTLMNARLSGYQAGHQQFDYPVHRLKPLTGSSTVTIAPGAQTGLFTSVGRLDPHTYRPNEFFASNWVYEGLVSYGTGGQVLPALAESWTKEDNGSGGETFTFKLRENVLFHDGEVWNCAAAKLNFDHVFAGALKTIDYHGWYGVPLHIDSWECTSDMELVVSTSIKYAPFLQELSYIRPLRMLSPAAFVGGNTSDPTKANSCHIGWGRIESDVHDTIECAGIKYVSGTGPFVFTSRENVTITEADGTEMEMDNKVVFSSNQEYWDGAPAFETLVIQRYKSSEEVKQALVNGPLDLVWGSGVLTDQDIAELQNSDEFQDKIRVFFSDDVQNVILLLNSGKEPLDDIEVRKTIMHAVDKSAIVKGELAGLQTVVDNVFTRDAPYCDVDLTPRWDYDFEKATMLSCDNSEASSGTDNATALGLGLGLGLGIPCVLFLAAAVFYFKKSKVYEAELVKKGQGVEA